MSVQLDAMLAATSHPPTNHAAHSGIGREPVIQAQWSPDMSTTSGLDSIPGIPGIPPGAVINNRYEIDSWLGNGGMGTVYRARDIILERTVAIKLVDGSSSNPRRVMRFHKEAKITARFDHPGIVKLLDFGLTENGHPFMVMDYVHGVTLKDLLSRRQKLPVEEMLSIFSQVTEAMHYAHSLGILHRDLTTGNLMLTQCETACFQVKIIDFGIARIIQTPDGQSADTLEKRIIGNALLDQRSDIYSLGCVMFEAFMSYPPFIGDSRIASLKNHLEAERPVRVQSRSLSAAETMLLDLIQTCILKEPANRYQTMIDVLERLLTIREHLLRIESPPPGLSQALRSLWLSMRRRA